MASHGNFDDDDDFDGDFSQGNTSRRSGNKRSFEDLNDDEDDIFGSKKASLKVEETAPGVATGKSLRESLKNCQDELSRCQAALEDAKSEIQKWYSSFKNESFIPSGAPPEPKFLVSYFQSLRSSLQSLREQLEKAKKKEAAFVVSFAKREQEISELKSTVQDLRAQMKPPSLQARRLLLDPAIHEEFMRLKNLVEEKDKKVKELQDQIAAVTFTPQSKMGKMLTAKCRTLQEENEEIGNQANEGKLSSQLGEKMHELAMKLAMQKSQSAELKSQFAGVCNQMVKLAGDADRSNEMVGILQEKLEEKDAEIQTLKDKLQEQSIAEKQQLASTADANAEDKEAILVEQQTED